jgi:DmsE family decaheme c-type cytochrome
VHIGALDLILGPSRFANEGQAQSGRRRSAVPLPFAIVTALLLAASLQAQQNLPAGYAGSDACAVCHDDLSKAFQHNPHHIVESQNHRGWVGRACESCHGPGAKHAESADPADILNPAKLAAVRTDEICLKCHLNQATHVGRIQGSHMKNQVACTGCHSMHKGAQALRPTEASVINRSCARCHKSVWAKFQKPYRHRLPEGAMSCTDCHNPHGSLLPHMIRTVSADEPSCFRCHSDKRGPFAFEHPPMQTEGCPACHEPHGSVNPRMLIRHEVRLVCLECHADIGVQNTIGGPPPAFHDLRSARYLNCTVCHTKIHGSYIDAALER